MSEEKPRNVVVTLKILPRLSSNMVTCGANLWLSCLAGWFHLIGRFIRSIHLTWMNGCLSLSITLPRSEWKRMLCAWGQLHVKSTALTYIWAIDLIIYWMKPLYQSKTKPKSMKFRSPNWKELIHHANPRESISEQLCTPIIGVPVSIRFYISLKVLRWMVTPVKYAANKQTGSSRLMETTKQCSAAPHEHGCYQVAATC